jgi:hypothetical protein
MPIEILNCWRSKSSVRSYHGIQAEIVANCIQCNKMRAATLGRHHPVYIFLGIRKKYLL